MIQPEHNPLLPDEAAEGLGVHRLPYGAEEAADDRSTQDRGHDQALPGRDRRLLEAQALPDYSLIPDEAAEGPGVHRVPYGAGEAADGRSTQDRGHDQALLSVIGDCSRPRPSPITRFSQSTTR